MSNGILHGPFLSNYKVMPRAEAYRAQTTRSQRSERQGTKSQLGAVKSRSSENFPLSPHSAFWPTKVHRGLSKAETDKSAQGLGVCEPQELTSY